MATESQKSTERIAGHRRRRRSGRRAASEVPTTARPYAGATIDRGAGGRATARGSAGRIRRTGRGRSRAPERCATQRRRRQRARRRSRRPRRTAPRVSRVTAPNFSSAGSHTPRGRTASRGPAALIALVYVDVGCAAGAPGCARSGSGSWRTAGRTERGIWRGSTRMPWPSTISHSCVARVFGFARIFATVSPSRNASPSLDPVHQQDVVHERAHRESRPSSTPSRASRGSRGCRRSRSGAPSSAPPARERSRGTSGPACPGSSHMWTGCRTARASA